MKKTLLAAALIAASFSAFAGGNIEAGKALMAKSICISCHGADFNSSDDPKSPLYGNPRLAGQHKDYLEHAMTSYKRGIDGANGRGNAIMGPQVKPLSAQEIKDIAAYLHSLPGKLVVRR